MIESLFTRQKIDSMRPHIQKTIESLLDAVIKRGSEKPIEFVKEFALPVPSYVSRRFYATTEFLFTESICNLNRSFMGSSEFRSRILNT